MPDNKPQPLRRNTGAAPMADTSMSDVLRAAADAAEAPEFDTGPLVPEEDTTVEIDGTVQEPDPAFKAGDHVTVTFTNGEVSDVQKSEPRTAPIDDFVTASGQLAVEFGPTNEFSQRQIASLREQLEELIGDVKLIDSQLDHLNKRRTDAMLACSGISRALEALGDNE